MQTHTIDSHLSGGLTLGTCTMTLELMTRNPSGFHDITGAAQTFVETSGIDAGMLLAQSLHTTAGLLLNEDETGLKADFTKIADQLIPRGECYRHDDFEVRFENLCPEDLEAPNGHSHLQHATFGAPSIMLIIQDRALVLGRWQRLLVLEFDRPRKRMVQFMALGSAAAGSREARPTDEAAIYQ
jgi:secondary thiamine-phosphate synthase enzyme